MKTGSIQDTLIQDIASFTHDPLGYVKYAFPWGEEDSPLKDENIRTWQADMLDHLGSQLRDGKQLIRLAVASGHGIGKAQPKDTVIPTPNGDVQFGDLNVGDYVFGPDGKPVKVIAIHEQGQKQAYKVVFDDRSETLCCEDHVWTVMGRDQRRTDRVNGSSLNWSEMTTKEILEKGVKRSNGSTRCRQWEIPTVHPCEYPSKKVPIDPYVLGLWLGNGGRNTPRISMPDDEVCSILDRKGVAHTKSTKNGHCTIWLNGMKTHLKSMGILDKYSYDKNIPDDYKNNDVEVRSEVLRGLLDTDGELTNGGSIVYSTTSLELANDVVWISRSLGGKSRISPTPKKGRYRNDSGEMVECRDCYRVVVTMPNGFNPFYTKGRSEKIGDVQSRYLKRWIDKIEPTGEMVDMRCITVENGDGLYLTNDFITTHNSALISMLIKWGLDTRENTRIIITAGTEAQMKTKTWPEVIKWTGLSITNNWFKNEEMSIYCNDPQSKSNWRCDRVTWSERNVDAFAGLHNKGNRIIVIFDEASAILDKIWEVTEGALTDADTEIIWIAFGNPTLNTGTFRECFRKFKHNWHNLQIDSRDVEGTNKELFNQWVEDYGEDSDFVKVRVRGIFPSASALQYISETDVDAAYGKHLTEDQYKFSPVIIGCDPAWQGDDVLTIGLRQGLMSKKLASIPKNDNDMEIANLLARFEDEYEADGVFIDQGYGTGIYSGGKQLGRNWMLVNSASTNVIDPGCFNKRAEMWQEIKKWLKSGGALPKDPKMHQQLLAAEAVPRADGRLQIEPKPAIKKRIGESTDEADWLGLTFAFPVQKKTQNLLSTQGSGLKADYDPFE